MRSAARGSRRPGDPCHWPFRAGQLARAGHGGSALATAPAAFARTATAPRARGQLHRALHARRGCRVEIGRGKLRGCRGDGVPPVRSSQPSDLALLRDVRAPVGPAESGSVALCSDGPSVHAKGRKRSAPRSRPCGADDPSPGARPAGTDHSVADCPGPRRRSRSTRDGRHAAPLREVPRGQRPGLPVLSILRRIARRCSVDRCRSAHARTPSVGSTPGAAAVCARVADGIDR